MIIDLGENIRDDKLHIRRNKPQPRILVSGEGIEITQVQSTGGFYCHTTFSTYLNKEASVELSVDNTP